MMPGIRLHVGGNGGRISLRPSCGGHLRVTGDYTGGEVLPIYEGPYSVDPSETARTLSTEGKKMAADVSVSAIPHDYVGTAVPRRASGDMTASGGTITAPAGYYAESASKAVASGTEGTPTATKGTVSGYSVTVTPSVTNSAGYIAGGTRTGTPVTVTASELVPDGDNLGYGS